MCFLQFEYSYKKDKVFKKSLLIKKKKKLKEIIMGGFNSTNHTSLVSEFYNLNNQLNWSLLEFGKMRLCMAQVRCLRLKVRLGLGLG